MEFKGKEINSLEDIKQILCTDKGLKEAIDILENIPKQIADLVLKRDLKLSYIDDLLNLVDIFSEPKSKALQIMIVKQLCPNQAGTDLEAELLLKQKSVKKIVVEKAKEIALDAADLVGEIKSFCGAAKDLDAGAVKESGKNIVNKIKAGLSNVDVKKQGKTIGRNVGISIVFTLVACVLLGFPLVSVPTSIIAGTGSAAVSLVTKKLSK